MGPERIRSLRGDRTRAEFARLCGVTPLTVLRWELPDGNKEARRPRRAMVTTLERLAAEQPPPSPLGDVDAELAGDLAVLAPVRDDLSSAAWQRAEDELLSLLTSQRLKTVGGRALATLALAQQQLLTRLDVRGALTAILPLIADVEAGRLPPFVAARVHVIAALLFGAPDARLFDPGRVNAHAAIAETLLGPKDEARVLLTLAKLSAARFLGVPVFMKTYREVLPVEPTSPVARCLLALLKAVGAEILGDAIGSARLGDSALAEADRLGLHAITVGAITNAVTTGLRRLLPPADVLALTKRARQAAKDGRLGPIEPLVRVLSAECEALQRAGRIPEARAVADEARELAARAGVPPYASACAEARLASLTNDRERLASLAASLDVDVAAPMRALVRGHLLHVRACEASVRGDYAGAAELCEQAYLVLETVAAADFAMHDVLLEGLLSRALASDVEGARAVLRAMDTLGGRLHSPYHAAVARQIEALVLMVERRFDEVESALLEVLPKFVEGGDVVATMFTRGVLAAARKLRGDADAEREIVAALDEARRLGITPRPLAPPRGEAAARPPGSAGAPLLADRMREVAAAVGSMPPAAPPTADAPPRSARARRASSEGAADPTSAEPDVLPALPDLVAASPALRRLRRAILQLSSARATILITGESGAGKEVVAAAIHAASTRAKRPYVAFNCSTVPRDLFEGQLFGHKKGAFTGADADSPGVLRAADQGTVFLDEIGELPLDVQPKLLRFLENGEVFPLGERRPVTIDVRVVAATHRDLARRVREGLFREDLYYRLNVVPLQLPPLRDRPEDVIALAERFVARLTPPGAEPVGLAPDALVALTDYAWPGNVRELRNVLERSMALRTTTSALSASELIFG